MCGGGLAPNTEPGSPQDSGAHSHSSDSSSSSSESDGEHHHGKVGHGAWAPPPRHWEARGGGSCHHPSSQSAGSPCMGGVASPEPQAPQPLPHRRVPGPPCAPSPPALAPAPRSRPRAQEEGEEAEQGQEAQKGQEGEEEPLVRDPGVRAGAPPRAAWHCPGVAAVAGAFLGNKEAGPTQAATAPYLAAGRKQGSQESRGHARCTPPHPCTSGNSCKPW